MKPDWTMPRWRAQTSAVWTFSLNRRLTISAVRKETTPMVWDMTGIIMILPSNPVCRKMSASPSVEVRTRYVIMYWPITFHKAVTTNIRMPVNMTRKPSSPVTTSVRTSISTLIVIWVPVWIWGPVLPTVMHRVQQPVAWWPSVLPSLHICPSWWKKMRIRRMRNTFSKILVECFMVTISTVTIFWVNWAVPVIWMKRTRIWMVVLPWIWIWNFWRKD